MTSASGRAARWSRRRFVTSLAAFLATCGGLTSGRAQSSSSRRALDRAVEYLARVQDQYHRQFFVYSDEGAGGNHFHYRAQLCGPDHKDCVPVMDEAWTDQPHSGRTCIKARFLPKESTWGGWLFMNGVLRGTDRLPTANWGDIPGAGVNLTGAKKLTWWARGRDGGEIVKFIAFGAGHDQGKTFADSNAEVNKVVTLEKEWKQYEIDVSHSRLDYVLAGFGWVVSAAESGDRPEVTFFIDDIQYDKPCPDERRLLLSYDTQRFSTKSDAVLRNVAYTYDNAIALLAFIAAGERDRAASLAEALKYAQENDPYYRHLGFPLRSAYSSGDLMMPPGWEPNGNRGAVRLPGWYDQDAREWHEDRVQVGLNAGNMAWAMLALDAHFEASGDETSLRAAERLGDWIETNYRDTRGKGGYIAGVDGWPDQRFEQQYKATEHNIDLYAAYRKLRRLARKDQERWRIAAERAKTLLVSMWRQDDRGFWTGTERDGETVNQSVIPLDVQAWGAMALHDDDPKYRRALDNLDDFRVGDQGFDFNAKQDGVNTNLDGVWFEGTAQVAAAFKAIDRNDRRAAPWLDRLRQVQDPATGALPATNVEDLTTGFDLFDGAPWLYHRRPHIAATAWFVLAEIGMNPLAG